MIRIRHYFHYCVTSIVNRIEIHQKCACSFYRSDDCVISGGLFLWANTCTINYEELTATVELNVRRSFRLTTFNDSAVTTHSQCAHFKLEQFTVMVAVIMRFSIELLYT